MRRQQRHDHFLHSQLELTCAESDSACHVWLDLTVGPKAERDDLLGTPVSTNLWFDFLGGPMPQETEGGVDLYFLPSARSQLKRSSAGTRSDAKGRRRGSLLQQALLMAAAAPSQATPTVAVSQQSPRSEDAAEA